MVRVPEKALKGSRRVAAFYYCCGKMICALTTRAGSQFKAQLVREAVLRLAEKQGFGVQFVEAPEGEPVKCPKCRQLAVGAGTQPQRNF